MAPVRSMPYGLAALARLSAGASAMCTALCAVVPDHLSHSVTAAPSPLQHDGHLITASCSTCASAPFSIPGSEYTCIPVLPPHSAEAMPTVQALKESMNFRVTPVSLCHCNTASLRHCCSTASLPQRVSAQVSRCATHRGCIDGLDELLNELLPRAPRLVVPRAVVDQVHRHRVHHE